MTNGEVAIVFQRIADIMEIQGENPFKVRAYRNAVRTLENMHESVEKIVAEGRLGSIPGFGDAIQAKTQDILKTGSTPLYDKLKDQVPVGVQSMLNIPGLGVKTIRLIWETLKIETIEALEAAASDGRLQELPGIGHKGTLKLVNSIEKYRRFSLTTRLGDALPIAEQIVKKLHEMCSGTGIQIAGDLRRGTETVDRIELVCAEDASFSRVLHYFTTMATVSKVVSEGSSCASVLLHNGMQASLTVCEPSAFGLEFLRTTGPASHVDLVLERVVSAVKCQSPKPFLEEASVYRFADMAYIAPELRDWEDSSSAASRSLELITIEDIRGDVHFHTTSSDGTLDIRSMAEVARIRGYEYLAITDHSSTLHIANGLSPERVRKQIREIRELEDACGIAIFAGSEVDILADGTLDFDDELLAQLDFVIASAHLYNKQSEEDQTARVVRAINNPNVDLIAHPTGRLINRRDPFNIDMDAIIKAAAVTGTALEINAAPDRLDLKDVYARQASEAGVKIIVNTDAHSKADFDLMRYGIMTARRAGLTPLQVVNAWPVLDFTAWLQR